MNKEAFISRVESSRQALIQIARSMVRPADCEDAVQSAILSAWEHLPQLRDEQAFDAWLKRILINRCRQIQRGYKREKALYAALEPGEMETDEGDSALYDAMEKLNDEQRTLIRLHHEQGYTLREMADTMGESQDVLKMRLSRARKRLRILLISLLLFVLLVAVAVGAGVIDVSWFLENRRVEPTAIEHPIEPETVGAEYPGELLEVSLSDAVWDKDGLSLSFVYSVAGKDEQALTVHSGNIGVDGLRMDHIWTEEGVMPVADWAKGKPVRTFSVDGWRLGGVYLTGSGDYLRDGLGETFMAKLNLDWIRPERYEKLLDEEGMLSFEADVTLEDYPSGTVLEEQTIMVRIDAPTPREWRDMYETYYR